MAQIRQRQRLSENDKLDIIDDILSQVSGWSDKNLTARDIDIRYVGRGEFEFLDPDDRDEPTGMTAHQCSCGALFADWADTGELSQCPGCGAYVLESLIWRIK